MTIEVALVLSGASDVAQVLSRALPQIWAVHPTSKSGSIAHSFDDRGFQLSAVARQRGYFEAASDAGSWSWEPESYVNLGFRIDKFFDRALAWSTILDIAAAVLRTGPEDVALILHGDVLLLRRERGKLERSCADFWSTLDSSALPAELFLI